MDTCRGRRLLIVVSQSDDKDACSVFSDRSSDAHDRLISVSGEMSFQVRFCVQQRIMWEMSCVNSRKQGGM